MKNNTFQDELGYLRDTGREFARLNPRLARYLAEASTDPDVERLLEGFAFLTSRVREKIDDEMSEFTHSVIKMLWPNFLRPFPSTTMMKFTPIDRSITERQVVARGCNILSRPVSDAVNGQGNGIECLFTTCSDCTVYPLEIEAASIERSRDSARLVIDFKTLSGLPLGQIRLDDLRLTFSGDATVRQTLHLWFGRYLKKASVVYADGRKKTLDPACIQPVGLAGDEAILPSQITAFDGHRLLQEYFVFPDKFQGYDFLGLRPLFSGREEAEFSLEFLFDRCLPAETRIREDNIRLYCVPAVNLFRTDADPLIVDHTRTHYRIRPHGFDSDHVEIFSIDRIYGRRVSRGENQQVVERFYPSFESFNHETGYETGGDSIAEQVYFYSRPRRSLRFMGFEYDLSFVHHNSSPAVPYEETLSIDITCFNRKACDELGIGDICVPTGNSPAFVTHSNITRATGPVYPPLDGTLNWNLISNLSLNYMSLLSRDTLAAILTVYDYQSLSNRQAERAARQRIGGILDLKTVPADRLLKGLPIRGLKSVMTLQESAFQTEGEMYLFAAIVAEFFTLYATVNSFHELEVHGSESGEIYKWPAKIGRQPLI